jgi:hypothetical protein
MALWSMASLRDAEQFEAAGGVLVEEIQLEAVPVLCAARGVGSSCGLVRCDGAAVHWR